MKKILYILSSFALCLGLSSCVKEQIVNDTEIKRHQVENLVATPGDEEIVLSWTLPEGWEPTAYLITYSDAASKSVSITTGTEKTYTVTDLVNEFEYTFNVQAYYGKALSGVVKAKAKPTTSRFPVANLLADSGDSYVTLYWEKPSTLVQSYTITYSMDGDEANAKDVTADKDAVSYEFKGLTNDKNYTFSVVANYAKGKSEAVTIKAMPALAVPYFVSATSVASGWPVTYTFNREAFPTATDVKWTFPDGSQRTGDEVRYGIYATGVKNVILTATVNGIAKEWTIEMTLREWVIETRDFAQSGTDYNGFKGSYPVFSPDGKTVYNLTFNKVTGLYAYDIESGTEKWRFLPETPSASYNPCTVNPVTGDIYFGTTTAKQFYCVSPEGKQKWFFNGAAGNMQSTAPAVSADGSVVYIIDKVGNTFALDAATGSVKWNVALGSQGGSLLINGNDLIVAICNTANSVQFLNTADGSVITSISLGKKPTDISGMAVSDDKKYAFVPLQGGMAKIDLASRTLVKELVFGGNIYAPAISSDGYVVAGSKDGCVYALKSDLSEIVWTYIHTGTAQSNVFNYSHACADTEGHVLITAGQKAPMNNIIFDAATGNIVSTYIYGDGADNAVRQMGGNNYLDGVFYAAHLGATGTNGAFIGKYVGGTRKYWGGPGGDICGSCCVQSPLL